MMTSNFEAGRRLGTATTAAVVSIDPASKAWLDMATQCDG